MSLCPFVVALASLSNKRIDAKNLWNNKKHPQNIYVYAWPFDVGDYSDDTSREGEFIVPSFVFHGTRK